MRTPHRRDISVRQDLLGRELRQLFDDYLQEDMPQELCDLAQKLQSAMETLPTDAQPPSVRENGADRSTDPAAAGAEGLSAETPAVPEPAESKPSV